MNDNKICSHCQAVNDKDARFCSECGARLNNENSCHHCGAANQPQAKFCAECGKSLKPAPKAAAHKKQPARAHRAKKTVPQKTTNKPMIIAAVVIALIIIYLFNQNNSGPASSATQAAVQPIELRSPDPVLEAKVTDIASKFICSCGTCGEQPLETCTCQTAVNERNYIRRALQSGQQAESIIQSVNLQYGWMKPQFKDQYGQGKEVFKLKENPVADFARGAQNPSAQSVQLASFIDRQAIVSKFACPCGQCGIDELKDCECNHPRGAKEVKAYIDARINEGKYSVDQITALVEERYGNRIR